MMLRAAASLLRHADQACNAAVAVRDSYSTACHAACFADVDVVIGAGTGLGRAFRCQAQGERRDQAGRN